MWTYSIQVRDTSLSDAFGGVGRGGLFWCLDRTTNAEGENTKPQEIISHQDEAIADALKILSILRCPIDKPIDHAIKSMLDDE